MINQIRKKLMKRIIKFILINSILFTAPLLQAENKTSAVENTFEQTSQTLNQEVLNNFAEQAIIKYQLVNSLPTYCPKKYSNCSAQRFYINSPIALPNNNWAIYFSVLTPVIQTHSKFFAIEHINGDLHKLTPTPLFTGLKANKNYKIDFLVQGKQITRSEFMPNFFIANEYLKARVIKSTVPQIDNETGLEVQPYLLPFTNKKAQFKVAKNDNTQWASSQALYEKIPNIIQPIDIRATLIPKPKEVTLLTQQKPANLAHGIQLSLTNITTQTLNAALTQLDFLGVKQTKGGLSVKITVNPKKNMSKEAYQLTINNHAITILATSDTGAFYGLISIAALLSKNNLSIPAMIIFDEPRYHFRGLHIDIARNFHSKDFILKTITKMASYKLNKLHLHLADDEGWRLQIPGLPELTTIGSKRCFDLSEQRCLLPQLGSGISGNSQVDGYLSRTDYIDILKTAKAHHIQVIPSLDMPGHSRAAIKSMDARYKKHINTNKAKALEYWLSEPEDTTQYSSIQYYNDNTLNVCLESTYRFIDKVVSELQNMHKQAGMPLSIYHIGADETAGAWIKSPACIALKQQQADALAGLHSLNGYFIERVAKMLANKNIEVAGWNDGLGETRPQNMPKKVQTNSWSQLYFSGHKPTHQQANYGWDTIISTPEVTYFDFPYQAHPQERGNHWAARALNTDKVFQFMPDNLPVHAEFWHDALNNSYQSDDRQTQLKRGITFKGLQAHLWSEMVRSDQQAEYMIFPRLLAIAERAWHKAPWELNYDYSGVLYNQTSHKFTHKAQQKRNKDWQRFATIISQREFAKLEKANIFYRIPTVATKVEQGKLYAKTLYPNIPIEYQDKTGRWHTFINGKINATQVVAIRATSLDGKRKGRKLKLHNLM